jgi:anti-sigma-K factor RskA
VNGHPQFAEDFDLYALGTLEGEEKQALDAHVKTCPECSPKLAEARGRVALLALAAPPRPAPVRVKERLMEKVGGPKSAVIQVRRVRALTPFWRWVIPSLALASLVLAFFAASLRMENDRLNRRLAELEAGRRETQAALERLRNVAELLTAPDTVKVTLVAGAARPVPQGKVFYHPQRGLLFYAANLPALPPGKTYQLWLVPTQGNPLSAGIFQADPHGNGEVVLPQLPPGVAAKAFAVTIEPAGGVPQPTGPKVLVGLAA